MKKSLLILLFIATARLYAQDSNLVGIWYLSAFTGDLSKDSPITYNNAPQNPTIIINEDFTYEGIAACNTFSGSFVFTGTDEDTFEVNEFTRTMNTCDTSDHTSFESSYFFYLGGDENPEVRLFHLGSEIIIEGMSPGFGLRFQDTVFLDTDDFQTTAFQLYPNPAENTIHISSESLTPEAIAIYSIKGHQVLTQSNTTQLDVSLLDTGVYFIKISEGNNTTIQRFVKK